MSEERLGPTEGASVVLDIGGDIGAVVLHTPEWLADAEIEIRPTGPTDAGKRATHTAVRARRSSTGARYAAVFPALEAGEYTIHPPRPTSGATRSVTVRGGQVTDAYW